MMKQGLTGFLVFLFLSCAGVGSSADDQDGTPSISFGLNGISDWSTQHPFLDLMKSARPWIGHLPNQWGGISFEELIDENIFDANGWPIRIPARATKLETLILTDQPEDATHLIGQYRVQYDGAGEVEVTGRGRVVSKATGEIVFSYRPGPGAVGIAIKTTEQDNPIRNIRVVKSDDIPLFEAGKRFNPNWIDRLGAVRTVRFMDWMNTNNSSVSHWEDLPGTLDFSYAWRGVPLSVMIALSNQMEADPWFTLPHRADDDLVRQFAEVAYRGLDPDRVIYVEYSNEVWNFIFAQAQWAQEQAQRRWGESGDGWMQFYGLRAAQVMGIWSDVFGDAANGRLRRVVSVHTGWHGLEDAILTSNHATDVLGAAPATYFDAYAVTGYFGYELGRPETLNQLLESAAAKAEREGRSNGLSRVALREYVAAHRFDGVPEQAAMIVRQGSLSELTDSLWPYHAQVAKSAGLDLVMYEGGTHAAPVGEAVDDERLVTFLTGFNYSSEMAELYETAMSAWSDIGGHGFNVFVDVAPPSKWGSWGALRHLNDDNPRWRALDADR